MATEQELKKARLAHAQAEFGDDPRRWFPSIRLSDEDDALREEIVREAQDPETVARWPEEDGVEESSPVVPLYGRVMAKRGPFVVVQTPYGRMQAYFPKELARGELKKTLKRTDLGDHILVRGRRMRTSKGDAALCCVEYQHLSKALLPPPEKWHGLKDVEKRYRERYVDLFANPEVAKVFRARTRIVQALRSFLDGRGYLEVETPTLHQVRGGATAKPFQTHHNALDMDLFLRIAPELYLKRLLVGGFDRVYEIARTFRNEGISTRHNPEFSLLELYAAYASYDDLMDLTEEMLRHVDGALLEAYPEYGTGRTWTLDEEFLRIPMRRAILDAVERTDNAWKGLLDAETLNGPQKLAGAVETVMGRVDDVTRKQLSDCRSHGERVFLIYELLAEPALTDLYRSKDGTKSLPVFITEYPVEVSPLARKNDDDPEWVDRFEIFVDGREMANAFSELNDPEDQAERFRAQVEHRAGGDEEAMDYDADYIRALLHGMPPAAGFGLGVDRLTMLLCNQPSIRDVLLFPLMRPEAG